MQEKRRDDGRVPSPESATEVRVDGMTGAPSSVKWDDSNMKTSYSNVCNVSSTREEVVLLFGTQEIRHSAQKEVRVQLSDRIILNPLAAKMLAQLLAGVVAEYERRFGPLGLDAPEGTVH